MNVLEIIDPSFQQKMNGQAPRGAVLPDWLSTGMQRWTTGLLLMALMVWSSAAFARPVQGAGKVEFKSSIQTPVLSDLVKGDASDFSSTSISLDGQNPTTDVGVTLFGEDFGLMTLEASPVFAATTLEGEAILMGRGTSFVPFALDVLEVDDVENQSVFVEAFSQVVDVELVYLFGALNTDEQMTITSMAAITVSLGDLEETYLFFFEPGDGTGMSIVELFPVLPALLDEWPGAYATLEGEPETEIACGKYGNEGWGNGDGLCQGLHFGTPEGAKASCLADVQERADEYKSNTTCKPCTNGGGEKDCKKTVLHTDPFKQGYCKVQGERGFYNVNCKQYTLSSTVQCSSKSCPAR